MICKICSNKTEFLTEHKLLNKYKVNYFRCDSCNFVQTEDPYWLNESYTAAITNSDIGMISRNISLSQITSAIIVSFFDREKKFIDYGGGYGTFVRLMRDSGFNFYWYDKFCSNLFARGFEHNEENNDPYEIVTAFEVLEHLVNPIEDIKKIAELSKNILFTTELLPSNILPPQTWWYYGLEHGQHIAFYTHKSLSVIANKFNLNLYSNGRFLHLLSNKKISPLLFNIISRCKVAQLVNVFSRRGSLISEDYTKSMKT